MDTRDKPASILNFTFEKPVKVQFLKFDLISYWGKWGGGIQYFAAIPANKHDIDQGSDKTKFFGNLQATSGIDNKLDTLKERSESFVTVLL